jgi:uncharacterized coiled-coil DUF342 family protein
MDANEFVKEFKKMQDELDKMNNLKQRYMQFANTLRRYSSELAELAQEIDPVTQIRNFSPKSQIINALYNKMIDENLQVTREYLEANYSDLDGSEINYVLTALSDKTNVKKMKDGRNIRLYYGEI